MRVAGGCGSGGRYGWGRVIGGGLTGIRAAKFAIVLSFLFYFVVFTIF